MRVDRLGEACRDAAAACCRRVIRCRVEFHSVCVEVARSTCERICSPRPLACRAVEPRAPGTAGTVVAHRAHFANSESRRAHERAQQRTPRNLETAMPPLSIGFRGMVVVSVFDAETLCSGAGVIIHPRASRLHRAIPSFTNGRPTLRLLVKLRAADRTRASHHRREYVARSRCRSRAWRAGQRGLAVFHHDQPGCMHSLTGYAGIRTLLPSMTLLCAPTSSVV